ncbi:hypothetical protein HK100_002614 [Physocladia obscura]|uniref:Aldehyde dehydrogenase domain-containing protein n=1 Tax=Physocladia obscura TaxID=109957 RepID=A0AAD5XG53_9FUNG|nr:hypothetical protein HK100_002614 [Physocladia obscura]
MERFEKFSTSFISGRFLASNAGKARMLINPSTARPLFKTFDADASSQIQLAVDAAQETFSTKLMFWSGAMRRDALLAIANVLVTNKDFLAESEAIAGKTITDSKFDVDASAECFRFFAGLADKLHGRFFSMNPHAHAYTIREPIGVCGLITSFNYPLRTSAFVVLTAWKLAPALASGNAVILKPAHQTPISTLILASLISNKSKDSVLPAGAVNVLLGDASVGAALVEKSGVNKISFTGSTAAGSHVAKSLATSNLRKATLELGGKNAIIVYADANLDKAVTFIIEAAFSNAGQNCCAGSRLYLHSSVHDQVIQMLKRAASKLKIGDALNPDTDIGPLVDKTAMSRVDGFISRARARQNGAVVEEIFETESFLELDGNFVPPTIFSNVADEDEIAIEEIFGPVLAVMKPFDTIEESVMRANSSKYGLAAGVFTESMKVAHIASSNLKAGFVWINQYNNMPPYMPLGGMKLSGYGKECGYEAIDEFTFTKSVFSSFS